MLSADMRLLLCRLRADRRGIALVEFALVLPLLLTMYLGGWQVSDAIACNRKVTITTRAIADLTSQYASLSAAQVDSNLNASAQIMAPYSVASEMTRVSEVYTDASGATKIVWSRAINGLPYNVGDPVTLDSNLKTNGAYLILGETQYSYSPVVLYGMTSPVILSEKIFMSPRVSNAVNLTS